MRFTTYFSLFSFVISLAGCSSPVDTERLVEHDGHSTSQRADDLKLVNQDHAPGFGGAVNGLDLSCSGKGPFSGGSCQPEDPTNSCQACVLTQCCAEQEACNSVEPMNSCAFGSILYEDRVVQGGEIACMMECLAERSNDGTLVGDQSDVEVCSSSCAASQCGAERASDVTLALSACIVGNAETGQNGCRAECGL